MEETPKEVFVPTKNWQPIPRVSRTVPFGYDLDPEDPSILLPNVFQLEALEKAKVYVKRFSYREVAEWLTNITGRKLSYVGLRKRLQVERTRRRSATAFKNWARIYRTAEEKARKIEEESLGGFKPAGE